MAVKSLQLNSLLRNLGLPAAALLVLVLAVFVLKWYLANAASANAAQTEIAEVAVSLAPNDPQSYYALAVLREKSFRLEDVPKAIEAFEKATALSPNDYRLWLALGRARDRNGDTEEAEKALRKALELAPNYAQVQWTLGNVLLREGKTEEALQEIRLAAAGDPTLAAPAVSSVWQVLDGDVALISKSIGDSPRIKAELAAYLAREKRFDEAFQIWNELPAADKRTVYRQSGEALFQSLLAEKKFAAALELERQISDEDSAATPEKFTNPGFESNINPANKSIFDWQIGEGAQPQIGLNNEQKHGGGNSLFLIFNSPTGKDFRPVSQTIVVQPERTYNFQTFFRSELKAFGTLRWEIADAASGKVLAATEPIAEKSEWTPAAVKFTTLPTTEAVQVRLARAACSQAVCPISGKVWFDDFSLEK